MIFFSKGIWMLVISDLENCQKQEKVYNQLPLLSCCTLQLVPSLLTIVDTAAATAVSLLSMEG